MKKYDKNESNISLAPGNSDHTAGGTFMSPPPFGLTASASNGPIQRATPKEDEQQGRNSLTELTPAKEQPQPDVPGEWFEDGENAVPKWARNVMDEYAARLKPLIAPWDAVRGTPHCNTADLSQLDAVYGEFRMRMLKGSKGGFDGYDEDTYRRNAQKQNPIASFDGPFHGNANWKTYMRTKLGDDWLTSVRESFDFIDATAPNAAHIGILEDMNIPTRKVQHSYELQVEFAVEAAAGPDIGVVGAKVHTLEGTFIMTYKNNLGMSWEQRLGVYTIGMGGHAGLSAPKPMDANVISSLGGQTISFGKSPYVTSYFNPNEVAGETHTIAMEAGLGPAGMSTGRITFKEGGRSLVIDNSGLAVKVGTSALDIVGVSAAATTGTAMDMGSEQLSGMDRDKVKTKPPQKRTPEGPETQLAEVYTAVLHFATQSNELDDADMSLIVNLLDRMVEREATHPGELREIQLIGSASPRYNEPGKSTPDEKNNELAQQRLSATKRFFGQLWTGIYKDRMDLVAPPGWDDKVVVSTRIVPQDSALLKDLPDDNNDPKYRAAAVIVTYETSTQYEGEKTEYVD